jgi:hypothetical protein
MGQKYRQGYDENGGVIYPAFFVDGMGDLAGEFNGGLDRDNFAQADIQYSDLDSGTNSVFLYLDDEKSDTDFIVNSAITEWQGGTGNNADGIAIINWTAPQDAHYDVHVSVSWVVSGSYSWVTAGTRPDRTDTFDTILLRVSIDGIALAFAGPFEDGDNPWSTYLCGSIQLPAGTHSLQVECQVVRRIAQDGQVDGPCTNTFTIQSRSVVVMGRFR